MPQFDPTYWLVLITWFTTISIITLITLHKLLNMFILLQYIRTIIS